MLTGFHSLLGITLEPLIILLAFFSGLVFKQFGYPPLPGYLLAGFISHSLNLGSIDAIDLMADLGITLLLFTIGLKLNLKELIAPQVWAVAGLQIAIAVPLTVVVILLSGMVFPLLIMESVGAAWTLAFALSFSSTVFAVKMFEDRGESLSLHATLAVGVLVIQDILAVIYLVFTSDHPPGWNTLVLIALPLLRPIGLMCLRLAGHGELVMLFGITIALGMAELFEYLHLKAGLGALLAGVILGNSEKSKELYTSLISLKDLLLIGFFLQIGYYGLPSAEMMLVALALCGLIFIRPFIYYLLFVAFKLRARTALLSSLALFNYSEFGLIVAAIATEQGVLPVEWLTTLALAVSVSFFFATPFNARAHQFYQRYGKLLHRFERAKRLPQELPAELGDAKIVVVGMGRVGQGAYNYFSELHPGKVVGVEESYAKVVEHRDSGKNCIHADASDNDFWTQSEMNKRQLVLISLSNHSENLTAVNLARENGYKNAIAVVARYPDEQKMLESMGCISFNLYAEAGHGFAEHVEQQMDSSRLAGQAP